MVRSVLDVLTLMPIGHWGDVHDADGWRRLFGKLTHSPKQRAFCAVCFWVLLPATPRLRGQLGVGRDQRKHAVFSGTNTMAPLGQELVCHAVIYRHNGDRTTLSKFTRHPRPAFAS